VPPWTKPGNPKARGLGIQSFVILASLAISLGGCTSKTEPEYLPMVVGASWEYRTETLEKPRGKGEQVRSGTAIIRCVGTERIGGKDYVKCVTFAQGPGGTSEIASWYRRGTDGFYIIRFKKENPEMLLIPLPLKIGDSWTTEESQAKTVALVESLETVDLPQRSYPNCFRLKYVNYDHQARIANQTTLWLAPGVGWIKAESASEAGGATTKQWLTKYSSAKSGSKD
jgi:hypothetical protein